ncbi:MAG: hypothetical protein ABG776_12085, partial [Cyanobacteria bacterium J06555_13]
MKTKIRKKRLKSPAKSSTTLSPFEDSLHLASLARIELRGRRVGTSILVKDKDANNLRFVFAFECQGIHSTTTYERAVQTLETLESGLKDLPEREQLTLHLGTFSSDQVRQEDLNQLIGRCSDNPLKFLLMADQARVQQLSQQGLRKPKFLRLYVTYTVASDAEGAQDVIEKLLTKIESSWASFSGTLKQKKSQRLHAVMEKALVDGFMHWEQLLINKLGLSIRALNEKELWESLWSRFNDSEPCPIPQLLILDYKGLREEVKSEVHSATMLTQSSMPVANRKWVKVKNNYVAPLSFLDKPGGWADGSSQLRYLWEVLSRDNVTNTEVFCQLSPANPNLVKTTVQRMMKQSNLSASLAEDTNSRDVGAELKSEQAIEAQRQMLQGASPIYTAVVVLIHRPNLDQLDEACRYVQSCFRQPAWVDREHEYAWKIWLQTLCGAVWETLMAKPFDRRQLYLTSEVPGLMPLMTTQPCDRKGFEIVADEGGSPIHLDLFSQHRNLGLFATTRAGKSVLVSGILTQALAQQFPIIALDFPKPDGTSTFTDFTQFVGGSYFDISKESNNLFEQPDLRHLPYEDQIVRFHDFQSFLESALLTMVVGSSNIDPLISQTVRALLVLALKNFFADKSIQTRYHQALEKGFGSPEWQETPTLQDFIKFCTPEALKMKAPSGRIGDAFQQIELQLNFWLSSRVGKAISSPSSFPTDTQLLVFALRNLSNDQDAAVLALSAYSAALRRALAAPASIFFIDEAPILFDYDEIGALIGRLCANGAKAGIRVILSGQDPDTIHKSPSSAKIFQNLSTRLIGRIQPTAIDSFTEILKYPREI